jgi:YggT family protein
MHVLILFEFVVASIIKILIGLTVLLMILRLIVNLADLNPFGTIALNIRRLSDPLVYPFRRQLIGFGADPKYAPIIAILVIILAGYFGLLFIDAVIGTIGGVVAALAVPAPMAVLGYTLYGLLAIYKLLIFVRIIVSWGGGGSRNRFVRFLVRVTDPMLEPLRRMIPPIGGFDISPIIAILVIMLFQAAIAGTLLRGFSAEYF